MAQQKKAKKVGRPKLPKGEAKGRIVPVRFTRDDLRNITSAARAKKQTLSEAVRTGLLVEAKLIYKGHLIELIARDGQGSEYEASGWVTNQATRFATPVTAPVRHATKEAAIEDGIAWCKEKIDLGRTNDAETQP